MKDSVAVVVTRLVRTHYKKGAPLEYGLSACSNSLRKGAPFVSNDKYIGRDVHSESTSIAVRNSLGKIVRECVIETRTDTGS